jgi:hypothetical protein
LGEEKMLNRWKRQKSAPQSESNPAIEKRDLEGMSNEIAHLQEEIRELRKVLYLLSVPTEIEKRGILELKELKDELNKWSQTLSQIGKGQMEINIALESLSQLGESIPGEIQKGLLAINSLERIIRECERGLRKEIREALVKELFPLIQVLDGMEEALAYAEESIIPVPGNHHPSWLRNFVSRLFKNKPLDQDKRFFDKTQWLEGLKITQQKLETFLKNMGITVMETVGKPFDPYQHQSVGILETSEIEENVVVKEEIKGYRYGEIIIRYPQVIVSKKPVQEQVES